MEQLQQVGIFAPAMLLSMYIVNRAGSLLYSRDFANIPRLPTNDRMRLLSTFHRSGFNKL